VTVPVIDRTEACGQSEHEDGIIATWETPRRIPLTIDPLVSRP
jgi:hypothetical protein